MIPGLGLRAAELHSLSCRWDTCKLPAYCCPPRMGPVGTHCLPPSSCPLCPDGPSTGFSNQIVRDPNVISLPLLKLSFLSCKMGCQHLTQESSWEAERRREMGKCFASCKVLCQLKKQFWLFVRQAKGTSPDSGFRVRVWVWL